MKNIEKNRRKILLTEQKLKIVDWQSEENNFKGAQDCKPLGVSWLVSEERSNRKVGGGGGRGGGEGGSRRG